MQHMQYEVETHNSLTDLDMCIPLVHAFKLEKHVFYTTFWSIFVSQK